MEEYANWANEFYDSGEVRHMRQFVEEKSNKTRSLPSSHKKIVRKKLEIAMNQIQHKIEKVFHNHDLVLWHPSSEKRTVSIPGVVVRLEEKSVIIRARVEGNVREFEVSPDELVER